MMVEHKLKDIVFCCIKDSPKTRPSAEELAELFQCESKKIQQKERIVKGGKFQRLKLPFSESPV